jgi:hypothetical protein
MTLVWHEIGLLINARGSKNEEARDKGTAETEEVIGSRDTPCPRPRQVRGVKEDCQDHVGGTEDAGAMTVNRNISKETNEAFEGAKRGGRLLARKGTFGREDA